MTLRNRLLSLRPVVAIVIGGVIGLLSGNLWVGLAAALFALVALVFVGPRSPSATRLSSRTVDPFGVGEPWRQMVQRALRAERDYTATAASLSGPVREYLDRVGAQLHLAVLDAWEIAQSGDRLDQSVRDLRPTRLRSDLAQLEARSGASDQSNNDNDADDNNAGATLDPVAADNDSSIASLRSQLDSVARLQAQSERTASELQAGVTRLGELVAHATEVAIGSRAQDSYTAEVDSLVTSLEALRQASIELPPS